MPPIISVASGKGGVGKSVVITNLALVFARRGYRTCLIDLDVGGADVHIMFGHFKVGPTLTSFLDKRVAELAETVITLNTFSNLQLIVGTGETLRTANMTYLEKVRLIREIRKLDCDLVLIDGGAGTGLHALDFFLLGDLHLCVTTPDPTAVMDLYRFVKLATLRRLHLSFAPRSEMRDRIVSEDFTKLEEVFALAKATGPTAYESAVRALEDFHPTMVLNRVTPHGSRINLLKLRSLLRQFVGVNLPAVGQIPDDPKVAESVRIFQPVVQAFPGSPSALALGDAAVEIERMLLT